MFGWASPTPQSQSNWVGDHKRLEWGEEGRERGRGRVGGISRFLLCEPNGIPPAGILKQVHKTTKRRKKESKYWTSVIPCFEKKEGEGHWSNNSPLFFLYEKCSTKEKKKMVDFIFGIVCWAMQIPICCLVHICISITFPAFSKNFVTTPRQKIPLQYRTWIGR